MKPDGGPVEYQYGELKWSHGDYVPDDDIRVPWPVLQAVTTFHDSSRELECTVTRVLAKCQRQRWLKTHCPHTQRVDHLWAAFRGAALHAYLAEMLSQDLRQDWHIEERVEVKWQGHHFSGTPDLWTDDGFLYDFKTTTTPPLYGPWQDHVEQVQVYRWLIDRHYSEDDKEKPDWQCLIVVYLTDKDVRAMPVTKSVQIEGQKRKIRVPDIWSDDTVEKLLNERLKVWEQATRSDSPPPIPDGWEAQSHPLCGFCPVRMDCAKLAWKEESVR